MLKTTYFLRDIPLIIINQWILLSPSHSVHFPWQFIHKFLYLCTNSLFALFLWLCWTIEVRNSRFGWINDDQKMLPDYNYLINGFIKKWIFLWFMCLEESVIIFWYYEVSFVCCLRGCLMKLLIYFWVDFNKKMMKIVDE